MSNHTALFLKLFALFIFTLMMLIPIGMILSLIDSRNDYQQSVINRIQDGTSAEQTVVGPVIAVPYTRYQKGLDDKGVSKTVAVEGVRYYLPSLLTVDGNVNVEPRKVGIYQAQVYQSELVFKGAFMPLDLTSNKSVSYGAPYVIVALSDSRGITRVPEIQFAKKAVAFEAGTNSSRFSQGVHAPLSGDMLSGSEPISFEFTLALQGSGHLAVMPVGESSTLNLSGNWPHPNFLGQFLPKQRAVNEDGFTATWESSWIANNINNNFIGYDYQSMDARRYSEDAYGDAQYARTSLVSSGLPAFSTSFIEPVNHYQLNTRTVKYAVLFIGLTFVAFFLFEVLKSLSIHPIQYLLVAAALTVFYVILLALSERIGFVWAYCIAAVSCCSLIGFYLSAVLRGAVRGIGFALGLLLLYGVLYLLLQSEDNALLLGALLLFVTLSAVMALTRRLDWYQVAGRSSSPSLNQSPAPSGGGAPAPQEETASEGEREKGTHCHSEELAERRKYRLWK